MLGLVADLWPFGLGQDHGARGSYSWGRRLPEKRISDLPSLRSHHVHVFLRAGGFRSRFCIEGKLR